MNLKQILLALVLADFVAFTGYVVFTHGYLGFFELALANSATALLAFDLVLALGAILVWMRGDAKARGTAFLPYALLTLGFGMAGPLLGLIVREGQQASAAARVPVHA